MSNEGKRIISDTKETFKRIVESAERAEKNVQGLDRDLASKVKKVKENASEIVKHIEERTGK